MDKNHVKAVHKFGLIGKDIEYSFSRNYFSSKFESLDLPYSYVNFDLKTIEEFPSLIKNNPELKGLNVTIPYKEAVMPFLDSLHKSAKKIGAVNTIKFTKKGKLKGYNTDAYGFKKSITPFIETHHKRALILGTGGASKAICYVLKKLGIEYKFVSRKPSDSHQLPYSQLNEDNIKDYHIIINCTPLGTFPDTMACPDIPYAGLTSQHLLFDLVYNPSTTTFMKNGQEYGAITTNGSKMLEHQAEKAWSIWMPGK